MSFKPFKSKFAHDIFMQKYSLNGSETWADLCHRVVDNVCGPYLDSKTKDKIFELMLDRKFIPAGRYLYSAGRDYHQVNNCFCFRAEDTREEWSELLHKTSISLLSGGGIGAEYSNIRPEGSIIRRTGGVATGPLALINMINECGRHIMQGGQRRSAIWAGLNWDHRDIEKFLNSKNWSEDLRALKEKDLMFPLPLDHTNISVGYDTKFFDIISDTSLPEYQKANGIWLKNCEQAFKTAEPGMTFNYRKDSESLRNACTELVSSDDSDKCNLGTLWISKFRDVAEFSMAIPYAIQFLLCGAKYSQVPTDKIREVGDKNNRIGLGIGGFHEWLMVRGCEYEVTSELHSWLSIYEDRCQESAKLYSSVLGLSEPVATRAIAPNGTIGILAESTTGIEPLFCSAYKRRYLNEGEWKYQYVVDGTVKRLLDMGVDLEKIKDSYDLSFEQRVKFQADVQDYIDMAISSTCNLPEWGTEGNCDATIEKYSNILLKYAKRLRGFTCYPDGCRSGQPLTKINLKEALENEGKVFVDKEHECVGGICGV